MSLARLLGPVAANRLRSWSLCVVGWAYLAYAYRLTLPTPIGGVLGLFRCPFLALTAHPCPLCGLTRSIGAALHADFGAALAFHPAGPAFLALVLPALAIVPGVLLATDRDQA